MVATTSRDQSPKIDGHLFDSERDSDEVGLIVSHNKSSLVSRLESLPETSPEPDQAMRRELENGFSVNPALLLLTSITCKRVRFSSSSNQTHAAVRVDISYEGNGSALRWQVPEDMLGASYAYPDKDGRAGRMVQNWSLSEADSIVSFYVILPPSCGESQADAEIAAAGLVPRLRRIIEVLDSMRHMSDEWNKSIPSLIDKVVSDRRKASARRETFLRVFRDNISNLLLSNTR